MGNKGYSEKQLFGSGYDHYDSSGRKIGSSEPGLFGGWNEYDANGKQIGHTEEGLFGGYNHYDMNGQRVGHTEQSSGNTYTHYDKDDKRVGTSTPTMGGGYSNNDNTGGCYIATCVYGSYDCPEVWTLRRFRDYSLAQSPAGRAFVKFYYAVSPSVVKLFGGSRIFRRCWRGILDRWIISLRQKGYESSPYEDRRW